MFIGEYTHSLDTKGRVALPAKFRQKISDGAIITRGLDHSLFLFNKSDWEVLAQKILALPMTSANSRAFARLMLSGAAEVEFDAQGRVLIPEPLRQYAGLKKQAVFAGVYNRVEIWDEASWKSYKSKTEASSDDIAEKLGELGI
jgi:MraZ protein